jgi:hypothetical protein
VTAILPFDAAGPVATPLSEAERAELAACERTIEGGLRGFVEVGTALARVRDSRLYRERFRSFERYCRERWSMARASAYRMIEAAEVVARVSPIGDTPAPANEAQARELARLPAEKQPAAWQEAVASAPDGRITAAYVTEVAERHRTAREPDRTATEPIGASPPEVKRSDCFGTPEQAVLPLVPWLPKDARVWEPACGGGSIVRALRARGFEVLGTDVWRQDAACVAEQDFLTAAAPGPWSVIITNPPGSIKTSFVRRCYELCAGTPGRSFALLMPMDAFGGKGRQELYREYGVGPLFLGGRTAFDTPEGRTGADSHPHEEYAWFTWGLGVPPIDSRCFWSPEKAATHAEASVCGRCGQRFDAGEGVLVGAVCYPPAEAIPGEHFCPACARAAGCEEEEERDPEEEPGADDLADGPRGFAPGHRIVWMRNGVKATGTVQALRSDGEGLMVTPDGGAREQCVWWSELAE